MHVTFPILFLFQYCLLFLLRLPPTAAVNNYSICSTSAGSYAAHSVYLANLDLLFSTLASNASASSPGFSNATAGGSPDQTYGLVLCRGDTDAATCSSCLNNATSNILRLCPYDKAAIVWFDYCLLRYSSADFLSSFDNGPLVAAWNVRNVTDGRDRFIGAVYELMNATADWAAYKTKTRFATGRAANFSSEVPAIYGMVQCTPDMPGETCRACLQDLIGKMPLWLDGRLGGRILGVRCNLRYETGQGSFYNVTPSVEIALPATAATTSAPAPQMVPPSAIPAAQQGQKNAGSRLAVVVPLLAALVLIYV